MEVERSGRGGLGWNGNCSRGLSYIEMFSRSSLSRLYFRLSFCVSIPSPYFSMEWKPFPRSLCSSPKLHSLTSVPIQKSSAQSNLSLPEKLHGVSMGMNEAVDEVIWTIIISQVQCKEVGFTGMVASNELWDGWNDKYSWMSELQQDVAEVACSCLNTSLNFSNPVPDGLGV